MFRARFASIFRSNTQNCNGSHQCVSMRVRWNSTLHYTRYVDDILVIYDTRCINDNIILNYINQIHNTLLNQTYESNNQINYLDLTIIRNNSKLEIDIYRKHPPQQTLLSTTHPTTPQNTKPQLIDTTSRECKHYHKQQHAENRMEDHKNNSKKQQFSRPCHSATAITNPT